jgi:hypothetical protein
MSGKVEIVINIDIKSDQIGLFVGSKGYFMKTKIIIPSKKAYLKSILPSSISREEHEKSWKECGINCKISTGDDDTVSVKIHSPTEECNKIVLSKVQEYVSEFNKKKPEAGPNKNNYNFKLLIDPNYVGKLIGIEGSKISELSQELKSTLNLDRRPYIKFLDSGHDNVETLTFKPEIDPGEVWLSITYVGEKSFVKVKSALIKFINTTLSDDQVSVSDDDGFEADAMVGGW